MDSDVNPDYYRDDSAESAISDTKATIEHIKKIDGSFELISPIITPRFAPSCSSTLLTALGSLAAESNLPIQTHIAENPSELALVAECFPSHDSYAAVYNAHGLLTPRTILAHAIHLSLSEQNLIRQCGSSVSHCPVSNSSISSGICPVRELLDRGIEVGLGTDVSGGWSPSILVAAREAAMVSRILAAFGRDFGVRERETQNIDQKSNEDVSLLERVRLQEIHSMLPRSEREHHHKDCERKKLSIEECLYLATVGGAKSLGLGSKIGRFDVGMEWDAQLIELEDFGAGIDESNNRSSDENMDQSSTDLKRPTHDAEQRRQNTSARVKEEPGPIELWGTEAWADKVAKWAFCGDDRNMKSVWVKGRVVHGTVI